MCEYRYNWTWEINVPLVLQECQNLNVGEQYNFLFKISLQYREKKDYTEDKTSLLQATKSAQ